MLAASFHVSTPIRLPCGERVASSGIYTSLTFAAVTLPFLCLFCLLNHWRGNQSIPGCGRQDVEGHAEL